MGSLDNLDVPHAIRTVDPTVATKGTRTMTTTRALVLASISRRFPTPRSIDGAPREGDAAIAVWRGLLASVEHTGVVARVHAGADVERELDAWCPSSIAS